MKKISLFFVLLLVAVTTDPANEMRLRQMLNDSNKFVVSELVSFERDVDTVTIVVADGINLEEYGDPLQLKILAYQSGGKIAEKKDTISIEYSLVELQPYKVYDTKIKSLVVERNSSVIRLKEEIQSQTNMQFYLGAPIGWIFWLIAFSLLVIILISNKFPNISKISTIGSVALVCLSANIFFAFFAIFSILVTEGAATNIIGSLFACIFAFIALIVSFTAYKKGNFKRFMICQGVALICPLLAWILLFI